MAAMGKYAGIAFPVSAHIGDDAAAVLQVLHSLFYAVCGLEFQIIKSGHNGPHNL